MIAQHPLTLVSAPAGYGKTTAIAAWADASHLPVAWLSLDHNDNDLTVFQVYFLAALRRRIPEFGLSLEKTLEEAGSTQVKAFVDFVWAELGDTEDEIVLVLDDFHVISNPEVLDLVRELMVYPHPAFHLVLISRHDPLLPLSKWRANNQLLEFRSSDLRFSREETAMFLDSALPNLLNDANVSTLYAGTEGWPAGLRLAALSLLHAANIDDYLLELGSSSHHISDYLADQVLRGLPPDRQTFLIRTSILDRMSGPLVEAVIADPGGKLDGAAVLDELYRENLFLVPLSAQHEWYRYHHLFRDLLRTRLVKQVSPEEIARLHMRAYQWYAARGYTEEAIYHAIAGGEVEEAVQLVAAKRHVLLNEERFWLLNHLADLFPEQVINESPDLLLAKAWYALAGRVDVAEVVRLTAEVDALVDRLDLDPERAAMLLAESGIMKGVPHYFALDAETSLAYFLRGLEVLPEAYYLARSYGWLYAAVSYQALGDLVKAFETARAGQREDLNHSAVPRARNFAIDGFLHWMAADLASMEKDALQTIQLASASNQRNTLGWGTYFAACVYYNQNDLDAALAYARKAHEDRFVNLGLFNIYTELILARVLLLKGNTDEAEAILASARAYALENRSAQLLFLVDAFEIDTEIMQGELGRAALWAEQTLPFVQPAALPMFFEPQLTVPKVLLALNDPANAEELAGVLQRLREYTEHSHNTRYLIEVLALEALFYDSQGDEAVALAKLEQSLALAEPGCFLRLYVDLGPGMKDLLSQLSGHPDLAEYIASIIEAFPPSRLGRNDQLIEPLTERELEILDLLAKRLSNKEIAQELGISPVTVKRHTINIYQKLNVGSRREAVVVAEAQGLLR